MHDDDAKDRPRYGHMLGGHLTLDAVVSFPISLLAAWLGLRFIAHAAFDAGELTASLAITWLGVSLIDSRLDYELRRATNCTAPPMPWPMVAVKMALPFVLPWLTILATIWHADMTTVAATSVTAGAIRLAEIIGLERPWRGEDQETIDRRRRELQRITRETAAEIREERQARTNRHTDAYDPYDLRGKR